MAHETTLGFPSLARVESLVAESRTAYMVARRALLDDARARSTHNRAGALGTAITYVASRDAAGLMEPPLRPELSEAIQNAATSLDVQTPFLKPLLAYRTSILESDYSVEALDTARLLLELVVDQA